MAVTEKRPLDDNVFSTKHIVMDIEGTTTSISFVKDTLFPYVRQHLDTYLSSHWAEDEFKSVLALLKDQAAEDKKADMAGAVEIPSEGSDDDVKAAVAKNVLWQMDADRKTAALKKLQGHIWREGYKNGDFKGHLFADVAPALREWVNDGRKLYVYSSGSVEAQKLLFGNSSEGDLTELFTDFFDTEVGCKVDVDSYKSIVKKLDCNADDVLFLTDMPKEASAAREAGLPVILVEREGNEPITSELRKEFSSVSSFQEVTFEAASKKQKVKDGEEEAKCEEHVEGEKPVKENVAAMEVDSETDAVTKPGDTPKAEAMDVDKEVIEPKAEAKEATCDVETKEENVVSGDDGTESSMKVADTKSEAETKEETAPEAKASESESSHSQTSDVADKTDPEDAELPKEDSTEKEQCVKDEVKKTDVDVTVVKEKTEQADQQEIEDKVTDKIETESEKPAKDTKTEDAGSKPEVEIKTAESLPAEPVSKSEDDTVSESLEGKTEPDKASATPKVPEKTENTSGDGEKTTDVKSIEVVEKEACAESKTESEIETPLKTGEPKPEKPEEPEEKEDKPQTDKKEEKEDVDTDAKENKNGVSNGTSNGTPNGTSNGTSNGTKDPDSNGTVENGHAKGEKDDIPDVIVAKNAAQVENGSGDAGVVVKA